MSRYFFSAVSLQGFNAEQIDLINRRLIPAHAGKTSVR